MILNICENAEVLSVIRIVKIIMQIIRIGVPILLMITLMIDYMKAVKDNDSDILAKTNKLAVMKVVAAVLIFLIPTFVNVIVGIADPNNKTYISCLRDATSENINSAYVVLAEKNLDVAMETLKKSDFQTAELSIKKVKNSSDRQRLEEELERIRSYMNLRESIYILANNFNREDYQKLKTAIEAIEDEKIKERLLNELKTAIGSKGSLAMYRINPEDELYRNLKNFDGKTLSSVLQEHGSSVEKLDLQIKEAVEAVGVGTREAPIAAAMTLIETLAEYGYRINYDWGGKWYHLGVDGNFGKRITPAYCDSHPNPDRCKTKLIWKGFDCSGFVNWALIQGFQNEKYQRQYTEDSGAIPLAGKTSAVCDVGDIIVNDKHITIVAGLDDEKKSYLIAESTGGGVKLSYYKYNNAAYYCRHIQYSN
jgi:hypothetical protein